MLKHHEIESIIQELLIKSLDDNKAVFIILEKFLVFQLFLTQSKLIVRAAQVLQNVLYNRNIPYLLEDPGLCLCYEIGWLHSKIIDDYGDNIFRVFLSKLYKK